MKKMRPQPRLVLSRASIRVLSAPDLAAPNGGMNDGRTSRAYDNCQQVTQHATTCTCNCSLDDLP